MFNKTKNRNNFFFEDPVYSVLVVNKFRQNIEKIVW